MIPPRVFKIIFHPHRRPYMRAVYELISLPAKDCASLRERLRSGEEMRGFRLVAYRSDTDPNVRLISATKPFRLLPEDVLAVEPCDVVVAFRGSE